MKFSSEVIASFVVLFLSIDAEARQFQRPYPNIGPQIPFMKREAEAKYDSTVKPKFKFNPESYQNIAVRDAEAKQVVFDKFKPKFNPGLLNQIAIGKRDAEAKNIRIPGKVLGPPQMRIARRDATLFDDDYAYDILARDIEAEWEALDDILQLREAHPFKVTMGIVKHPRDYIPSSGDNLEEILQTREFTKTTFKPRIGILANRPRDLVDDEDM